MGFGIDRRARSRKARGGLRALFGKAPDAAEVGDRLVRLARRMLADVVVDAGPRLVTLRPHPAAPPVRLAVLPDGDLEVTANTLALGPGYHVHVLARLAPLLDELEYAWAPPAAGAVRRDAGDGLAAAQRAMASFTAGQLEEGAPRLGVPGEREFVVDAAVLTALGPRDAAWRAAVLADPPRAADAFPWWDDAPGAAARAAALLALWHEVPWREPLDADERAVMARADEDLAAARRAAPGAALPWAAWAELRAHLGEDVDADLAARAAADAGPPVGYRRYPLEVELTAGWRIVLPGAFVGRWEDDGERYWATDGDRLVEIVSFTAEPGMDAAALLAVAPERHPVIAREDAAAHEAAPARAARAEAYLDGDTQVVIGLVACPPQVAILTCKGPAGDVAWALEAWRGLRVR